MTLGNIRHLRLFLTTTRLNTITRVAGRHNLSQPAVTQALAKLEADAGGALFDRMSRGLYPTDRGLILARRVERALALLDPVLRALSPRLVLTATSAQLTAFIAVCERQSFTLAATALGLAQPTVHRAVGHIEAETSKPLFHRTASGLLVTPLAEGLARAARLAFSELDQGMAELADFDGREGGRIVIGSLPPARSALLPKALAAFRQGRPATPVSVVDGSYDMLLDGLLRGEVDCIVGALRDPAPTPAIVQEALFADRLALVVRPGHPLVARQPLRRDDLSGQSWAVPRSGTPTRAQFDAVFCDDSPPDGIIETGSILLMREVLALSDLIGCISGLQAEADIANGSLVRLETDIDWPAREIGLATRANWLPTRAQQLFLDHLRACADRMREAE